ncbi:hypothetical protein [Candidatus Tisiphia endosymbiont of Empis tessellata]|uniref:hypothetical protein n=1 Tax=Candidatus Tisiphia endosymbiont of Empis tessellata TaxID=3066259 RepID=UPI00313CA083
MYQKTTELVNNAAKKEHHLLHVTFQLEDINMHLKMLLDEFRIFANSSNTTSQTKKQK